MQIETLKVFCDLVDTTSFSQAADLNGVTQSAVSQQIRNLEKKYEVAFFERGKKNFSITPEGQAFDGVAREILELFKSIDSQLKEINDVVSGKLHIASVHSIGLHLMPPVVGMFKDSYPDVEVVIDYRPSNQVYIDVLEGRADLGLVAYPKPRKGVIIEEYTKDKLVMICSPDHPLSDRRRIRIENLAGEKFIGFDAELPTRKAIDKLFREAGIQVNQIREFDNIETLKRAVEVEGATSIVPEETISREVGSGVLVAVEIAGEGTSRPLGLVKKRTRSISPAMREMSRLLKGESR